MQKDPEMFDRRAVVFAFAPGEAVTITAFGLNHRGVVERCVLSGSSRGLIYEVEYCSEGSICRREFWEDQLERACTK